MKVHALFGAALAATALFLGTQACTKDTAATPAVKCTPGVNSFCLCSGGQQSGTKRCNDDGASFAACITDESGEPCVGGEGSVDPGTGEVVDDRDASIDSPGSPIDSCPGKPTSLNEAELVIEGDTTGAKDTAKGRAGACAAGSGGPDHIYHLQPTASGALSIKVQGFGALNPTLYLRSACDVEESQLKCAETTGAGGAEQFQHNVRAGQSYYLVVDGASGSAGKYTLTMKLTAGPFCGDGKITQDEACDDTNTVDGDGCSPGCNGINSVDGKPAGADCVAPHVVHMWKGKTVSGTGDTSTYGNPWTKHNTLCDVDPTANNPNPAPEHVYEVTAHAAGTLKVTMTPAATFNAQLVARTKCDVAASQGANMCANNGSAGAAEIMSFPVAVNEKVYVAASGVLNQKGPYTIKFELP